jgi:glucan phosphoethanolaminetransferase (alkaline phosphatase superfamily)
MMGSTFPMFALVCEKLIFTIIFNIHSGVTMTALSVLDLVMIGEGKNLATAINESRELAVTVEQHGFRRYWIAEHHDMPGIGSAATSSSSLSLRGNKHYQGWLRRHHAAKSCAFGGGRAVWFA